MDLSKLNIFGKIYNFKDAVARNKGEENAKAIEEANEKVASVDEKVNVDRKQIATNKEDIGNLKKKLAEKVSDVRINGESITSNERIADIPISSVGKPGVIGIPGETYGLSKDSSNNIQLIGLTNEEIKKRFYTKPLMGNMLDYAVKIVMTDGKGAVWTDLEKSAAKSRIGIDKTDRKLDALWKLNHGISYQFETDDTEAYQKTVPSGAKLASVKKIGGRTIARNRLDNEGTLMSIPVNEVVEQGKNCFDFSKLVSDGVNVMDYEKQTITVPAKTNNTGYNQTLRDLCPGITPGTYVFSMKCSNPEGFLGSYFLEAAKDFPANKPIELTGELLDNHIAWYNNHDSDVENVISEIQIEKNSVKTLYSQYYQKSHKIPQAILELDG